ncbi:MAG: threonine synthase [Lachnospiraceae bacterium]|nr:threonine synthase [Lachnospiraceae bacterium]
MEVLYRSTRGGGGEITASQAILRGIAPDGGLYVPCQIPVRDLDPRSFVGCSYQETALRILRLFLTDFTEEELKTCVKNAYGAQFDTSVIAPVREAMGVHYLELYHGPTIAFKDMALQLLPHLMTTAARKNGSSEEIVILTATSGDTGKAALEGFAGVPGTRIVVFYPKDGVSPIQELQMVTTEGDNTCVIGIDGNFDDAQNGVKKIFTDERVRERLRQAGFVFSSANSINIGRLVPQIVYYVYGYASLLASGQIADGEKINIAVPTGNFGNILAAWYAMQIGLPVGRLICASNENKVLFDFFGSGVYDRNRPFILTSSPSMDILISSNLERLIYHISGEDPKVDSALMARLASEGRYEITDAMRQGLQSFTGGYADEQETLEEIRRVYDGAGYLMDTHTAVASAVCRKYREQTSDPAKILLASTASPYKFPRAVMTALGEETEGLDDLALTRKMHEISGTQIPAAVQKLLDGAPVRHERKCSAGEMEQAVLEFLSIR